jgi:hypothetical protein
MTSLKFNKINTILGWVVFAIALIVYTLTIEPTVSFWDAGEYILTSSKLQVGHPPGAPFFQMLGAFFSIFALEPSQIGFLLNMMSALSSAFTILFMFWSITLLLKKLVNQDHNELDAKAIAILGSGLVGSLAFTFTDTFWFNAVETEVYAMATLIMSVMFYLGLRWEQDMHTPRGNKWLILIAFVVGLSFGVHFMGLLTIPAIGLIYYFKNYKTVTLQGFILANVISVAVLLFVFKLMFPNILRFFSALEIFFVNTIGLPFNSGSIIAGIILVAFFYFGLNYTRKKELPHYNTILLCLMFVIIGSSSWLMLPIRANANVVINENNPESARELLAYYNLEQYPETHLFYGPQFTEIYSGADKNKPFVDDKPKYEKDDAAGKYVIVNDYKNAKQNFNSEHAVILPRMWSAEHAQNYMMYTGYVDFRIKAEYRSEPELAALVNDFRSRVRAGEIDYDDYNQFLRTYGQSYLDVDTPSFASNIAYMIQYQLGYMYWRYFMWNFTGRQNDIQGKLDNFNGNWISGINLIDEWHLEMSQENLPSDVKNNKGRNTYYFLPFLLGLLGMLFLLQYDKKRFWVMLVFFLFTGIAIQVYTNVRPFEPRERDYSVVGSFYVFAIWIGFGVYALYDLLQSKLKTKLLAPAITTVCLIVPLVLAANNWDDHDRSKRRTAEAMAVKYLESCGPNAILFTIGDNDTFPLWYTQEIEGIRTDVRVVNTSLFQTDWYIDQMKRKAYESDPIPSQLTHDQYKYGTRDYIMRREITQDTLDIKDFIEFVSSDNPRTKLKYILQQSGEDYTGYPRQMLNSNYFPTRHVKVPVNKENVLKSGLVKPEDADKIEDYLYLKIDESALYKNRLLMLDIVANNNWEREICFSGGSFGNDDYIWLKDYLQLDGMVYKLVPIKTPVNKANPYDMGRVDSDSMYQKVMSWDWGNSGSDDIYHDPETRKNGITYRGNLARLIEQLINEEKYDKAEAVADLAMEKMPVRHFEYYTLLEPYISAYYEVESEDKARALFLEVAKKYQEQLVYFASLSIEVQKNNIEEIFSNIERYRSLVDVLVVYKDTDFALEESKKFNNHLKLFEHFMGPDEVPEEETPISDEGDAFLDSLIKSINAQNQE